MPGPILNPMINNIRPSVQMKSLTSIYKTILSKEKTLDFNSVDPVLLNQCLTLGFGPLLHFYGMHDSASSSFQSLVLAADLSAKVLTGNQIDALDEIINAAGDMTGDIILLKGMSVAFTYYPEPYMRTMGDIDLLVSESRQVELENICFRLGYVHKSNLAEEFYIDHHHRMPLFNSSNNVWVEIHTSLFSKKSSVHTDYIFKPQNFMEQIRPLSVGPNSVSRLGVELELLYICAHWASDLNWQRSGLRLLDILYIFNDAELDWEQISFWLAKSPATAKVFIILLTLFKEERLFNVTDDKFNDLENYAPGINSINLRLLTGFIRKYLLFGENFGVLLTENNVGIIWNELLFGRFHPTIALFVVVPYRLLFPPGAEKKYSIKFQLSRIKNMFSRL